jgi:hypothetical protein
MAPWSCMTPKTATKLWRHATMAPCNITMTLWDWASCKRIRSWNFYRSGSFYVQVSENDQFESLWRQPGAWQGTNSRVDLGDILVYLSAALDEGQSRYITRPRNGGYIYILQSPYFSCRNASDVYTYVQTESRYIIRPSFVSMFVPPH